MPTTTTELPSTYRPADVEPAIATRWNDANAFHAEPAPANAARPYSIVIPPPNVTAALHMGHALNNTIQDILIRHHRMLGDNAMWMPGTDHAGIATQTVVEKRVLETEGKRRTDFQRDEFVEKIQAWKDEYEQRITDQLKAMGCSCDWDRQRFTMDDQCAKAVREAFFQFFKDGLIYRGKRLVNWDPVTQTALADDEVEMQEVDGNFYYLKYPVCDATGAPHVHAGLPQTVTVATTRPETMLGDTAVAMHPSDPRAAELRGKYVKLPIVGRVIPIIEDDYVTPADPESSDPKAKYSSGFLKVTPAHDPNDWTLGEKHNLEVINVMGPDASISDQHGWTDVSEEAKSFLGLSREEARKQIVKWFKDHDLLEEVKPYRHSVGHSYRSHVAIEPYLSDQWYIGVTKPTARLGDDDTPVENTTVPRNSLAGAALRALADDNTPAEASGKRKRPSSSPIDHPSPPDLAYLLTWTCHGTWLHGDERGSVDNAHNEAGSPFLPPDPVRQASESELAGRPAVTLPQNARRVVCRTVQEVCDHRGWRLLACNVRSNHAHVLVEADAAPEKVMSDLKAWATRRLTEAGHVNQGDKVWTEHGSTRWIKGDRNVAAACRYVLDEQGHTPPGCAHSEREASASASGSSAIHGESETVADASRSPRTWERGLNFTPARYAKTFRTWHENIRDWCISRQLWWGHRIPVWSYTYRQSHEDNGAGHVSNTRAIFKVISIRSRFPEIIAESDSNYATDDAVAVEDLASSLYELGQLEPLVEITHEKAISEARKRLRHQAIHIALREHNEEVIAELEAAGFTRDPDVLDTWFSSGLWPLSTLGWPEDTPELNTWNPTDALCTAREIITLWVSRMTMFNLYFRGTLPFRDVFIHSMIQDGDGRKMSKSLGNGVDPLDIIHSHGSDAMRFTLASMTTHTQDVRMPVTHDPETGRNTSEKFDLGRNFANKLWNAVRFALPMFSGQGDEADEADASASVSGDLADRWILSRLARTIDASDQALREYRFADYAQTLYDFFWRDLCDWYIEAIKPTVRGTPHQRAVLATCIDASLRLLHPIMPFITERLWEALNQVAPNRGVQGVTIDASDLLITAAWPRADAELIDDAAERDFTLIQELVSAVRQVRTTYQVPPRQTVEISAQAPPSLAQTMLQHRTLMETLANFNGREVGPDVERPGDAAVAVVAEAELYIHGLIDPDTERQRLEKRADELAKQIKTMQGRLSNEKYVAKAPAKLVQETRDQLAAAEREAQAIAAQLAAL